MTFVAPALRIFGVGFWGVDWGEGVRGSTGAASRLTLDLWHCKLVCLDNADGKSLAKVRGDTKATNSGPECLGRRRAKTRAGRTRTIWECGFSCGCFESRLATPLILADEVPFGTSFACAGGRVRWGLGAMLTSVLVVSRSALPFAVGLMLADVSHQHGSQKLT